MPTRSRPEDALTSLFARHLDHGAWADARTSRPDHETDSGVDLECVRPDGKVLAIEHTLVQFFDDDISDFERSRPLIQLENDSALEVADRIVRIDIPRGAVPLGRRAHLIAESFRSWLLANIRSFPDGETEQVFADGRDHPLVCRVEVIRTPGYRGQPQIRRYGPVDVSGVVKKAVDTKLPKLLSWPATDRVLLLEKKQWQLDEREICRSADLFRQRFGGHDIVDIWVAETVMANRDYSGSVAFRNYSGGAVLVEMEFYDFEPWPKPPTAS